MTKKMLVLEHSQVRGLLPTQECMAAVAEAPADLARGEGVQPLRSVDLLEGVVRKEAVAAHLGHRVP